ncbi:MAG: hypothetical protein ACP5G2_02325 [Candidatus Bipolaricaulaceae bacterium]
MTQRAFSLAKFGRRVGTRAEGVRARDAILRELERVPAAGKLVADLSGLEVLSGSFADEALVTVAERLREGAFPQRYLLIKAGEDELLEDLSDRLARRGLALLAVVGEGGGWRLLGKLPAYLEEALAWVVGRGTGTSIELAASLGISKKSASVRLGTLARLRLIHCVQEARRVGGVQFRAVSLISTNANT